MMAHWACLDPQAGHPGLSPLSPLPQILEVPHPGSDCTCTAWGRWERGALGPSWAYLSLCSPRAEQLASLEAAQRAVGVGPNASSLGSNARAEFWRLRGLRRGAKRSNQQSREDLSALTKQGRYPPYERVVLREGEQGQRH